MTSSIKYITFGKIIQRIALKQEARLGITLLLVLTLMRLPSDECIMKSWNKQLFSKLHKNVMTGCFVKRNAKTAFFKAIHKYCTTNQLLNSFN